VPTGTGEDSARRSLGSSTGRRTQDSARGDTRRYSSCRRRVSREHSDLCGIFLDMETVGCLLHLERRAPCGIISETARKGDRVAFEVEVPGEVDPDLLGCEAVGVSLLFGWLGQTDRLNDRTDHLAEYGFRNLILGG
jgi:hypothetical protein